MENKKFIVVSEEGKYDRELSMYIQDDIVYFDTAGEEYGKGSITVEELEKAIDDYKKIR